MKPIERFLHYITYDTQSDEDSALTPSTPKQKRLGARLAQELQEMGLEHAHLAENGAVYGWLPATAGKEDLPVLALIAHMDTAPRVPGENVKAKIVRYEGGDLVLNAERGIVMTPTGFPDLNDQVGKELIVTDGTTLLGADDKAGVAEIFSAVAYLAEHPELSHGRVAVCITPDEEVGRGADYIDLDLLGADFAYTVDGGPLGTLEYENFNAASAEVVIHGVNIHPGDAKNKMKNAWDSFEARKQTMQRIGDYLNEKYGPMSVEVRLTDSYYNMKEKILPHPELLDWARAAFRQAGVETVDVPIRGGTDGARLSFLGLPCPNLSTGGYHFHGVYEYIPVESLEKMTETLVNLVTGIDKIEKH